MTFAVVRQEFKLRPTYLDSIVMRGRGKAPQLVIPSSCPVVGLPLIVPLITSSANLPNGIRNDTRRRRSGKVYRPRNLFVKMKWKKEKKWRKCESFAGGITSVPGQDREQRKGVIRLDTLVKGWHHLYSSGCQSNEGKVSWKITRQLGQNRGEEDKVGNFPKRR